MNPELIFRLRRRVSSEIFLATLHLVKSASWDTFAGIEEGVLYRRSAAGADTGICLMGCLHSFPTSSHHLPFPYLPSHSKQGP